MEQHRHILIVDDNKDVRDIVGAHLRELGDRVSEATDGAGMRAILQSALAQSDPVDAIVLDYVLRGETGYSLALHAERLGIPIVLISASIEILRIRERPGLKVLAKPFRREQLLAALASVLAT